MTDAAGKLGVRDGAFELRCDGPERRRFSGFGDQNRGRAAAHRGSEEHAIGARRQGCVGRHHAWRLFHRKRLAGQRRLGHQKVAGGENAAVGRDEIARSELDDIARNEIGDWNRDPHSVTQGGDRQRQSLPQLGHGY